jgi:predicted aspartyl protease
MSFVRLIAICMFLTTAPALAAGLPPPAGQVDTPTEADQIAIGTDREDRMTVAVQVAGRGPYRFLVDTGSERTVISRDLAHRLRLVDGRNVTVHSVIGSSGARTVDIPSLMIGSRPFAVFGAPALEASHIGADGMLGIDSLRKQHVLFDFKSGTMSVTPAQVRIEPIDGDVIVVRARSRRGRLIFTEARLNRQKVVIVVDTGSQVTIGNLALQRKLLRKQLLPSSRPVTLHSVTGETMIADMAMVGNLDVGGFQLKDLPVAFADAYIFKQLDLADKPTLLLGMNALRAFDQISIDFAARKVRFDLPGTNSNEPEAKTRLAAR